MTRWMNKMPFDKTKYPADWVEIRNKTLKRAENRCEFCGAENYLPNPITGSKVILTIAHLDHDTTHNTEDNLRALCQRCHLKHDRKLHSINAARTRKIKKKIIEFTF